MGAAGREDFLETISELECELAEARKDAEQGWDAFYKLRKQLGADKYPDLTGAVRAVDRKVGTLK